MNNDEHSKINIESSNNINSKKFKMIIKEKK